MDKQNDDFFEIIWEGKPAGLLQRLLTKIHMNFTTYQVTKDELIITTGMLNKKQESCELYLLKDVDLTQNLYQQILKIGTVSVHVDANSNNSIKSGKTLYLSNIRTPREVRKVLRDAIEADVMERKITYFDKV